MIQARSSDSESSLLGGHFLRGPDVDSFIYIYIYV